jgi:beta-mannosidase
VNTGDAHYFGHGPYLRSFDDVRLSNVRFASETLAFANVPEPATVDLIPGGASGAGHHPGWKRGVTRDPGASWDFEDVREHYVEQLFRVDISRLRRSDPERYLALGRVASGEIIGQTVKAWRRADSSCQGALLWMMRDLRIGAGWGIVDSLGTPKAAYYYFRRAALPAVVVLSDEGLNGIRLDISNDRSVPLAATLRLALYRHGEVSIADVSTKVTVPPRSTETLHGDALLDQFVDPTYAYRFGPPGHDLVVAALHDAETEEHLSDAFLFPLGLPNTNDRDPGMDAEATLRTDGAYDLRMTTRTFAQSVAIDAPGFRADDNYIHIAPGSARTTVLRPLTGAPTLDGTVTPLNAPKSYRITLR